MKHCTSAALFAIFFISAKPQDEQQRFLEVDAPGSLLVGFAEADITPVLGKKPVYIAGFGKNRTATKVHDPIMVRAIVLEHDKKKIAIVAVDLVGVFNEAVVHVRKELPGYSYVLVSSTHNHEGPDTLGLWGPTLFASGVDPDYLKRVEAGIVQAIRQADKDKQAVRAGLGSARAHRTPPRWPRALRQTR